MFNYVVKDPDSSGLSREFWIKDQAEAASKGGLPRVLELGCAVVYLDCRCSIAYTGLGSIRIRFALRRVTS